MAVIGSVEFEASLSLDKFNQQLDRLITKNKSLSTSINITPVLDKRIASDLRQQFENQIKNDTSICIPLKFCDNSIKKAKQQLRREFKDFCIPLKFCKEDSAYRNSQKTLSKPVNTSNSYSRIVVSNGNSGVKSVKAVVTNPVSIAGGSIENISVSTSRNLSKGFQDVLKTTTIKSNIMGSLIKFDILKTITSPITGVASGIFKDISSGINKGVNEKIASKVGSVEKMATTLVQNASKISEIISETSIDTSFISNVFDKIYDLALVRFVIAEGKYKAAKSSQADKTETYEKGRVQLLRDVSEKSVRRTALVDRQSKLPTEISSLGSELSKTDLNDVKKVEKLLIAIEQKQQEIELVNQEIEQINDFITKMLFFLQGGKLSADIAQVVKTAVVKKEVARASAEALANSFELAQKITIPEDLKIDIDKLGIPGAIEKIEQELMDLQETFVETAKKMSEEEASIKSGMLNPEMVKNAEKEKNQYLQSAREIEKQQASAREKIKILQMLQTKESITPEALQKLKTDLSIATKVLEHTYDQIGFLTYSEAKDFEAEITQSKKKRDKKKRDEEIDKKTAALSPVYIEIAKEVVKASGGKLNIEDIPRLRQRPEDVNYGALYQIETNSILVSPAILQKFKDGIVLSFEEIEIVVHELRHAVQHGFGKEKFFETLVSDDHSLQPSTPEEVEQVRKGITFSTAIFPDQESDTESLARRKKEVDAYTFARRNAEKIKEEVDRNLLLKKLESRVGYTGGGVTDKRIQDGTGAVIARFIALRKEAIALSGSVDMASEEFKELERLLSVDYFNIVFGMIEKVKEKSANSLSMSSEQLKPVVDFVEFLVEELTTASSRLNQFVGDYASVAGETKPDQRIPTTPKPPQTLQSPVTKPPQPQEVKIPLKIPEVEQPNIELIEVPTVENVNKNFQEAGQEIEEFNEFLEDFPQLDLGDFVFEVEEDLSKWENLADELGTDPWDDVGDKLKDLEGQVDAILPKKIAVPPIPTEEATATPPNIQEIKTPTLSPEEKSGIQKLVSKDVQKKIRAQLNEIKNSALSSSEKVQKLQEIEKYIEGNIKALAEVSNQSQSSEKTFENSKKNIKKSLNGQLSNLKNLLKQTKTEIDRSTQEQKDAFDKFGIPKPGNEMLGIGAGVGIASSFFTGGAAQAVTVGAGSMGALSAASILPPVAAVIGSGVISIAIARKIRPLIEKEAPNIAKILYFDIGKGVKSIAEKFKGIKNDFIVNAKMALLGAEIKEGNKSITERINERIKKISKVFKKVDKNIDDYIKREQEDLIAEAEINGRQVDALVESSRNLGGTASVDEIINNTEKRRTEATNRRTKKIEKRNDLPRSQEIDFLARNKPDLGAITTGIMGELSTKIKETTGVLKGYISKIQESIDKKVVQSSYAAAQDAQGNLLPALQSQIERIKQVKKEVEGLKVSAERTKSELAQVTEQVLKESKYRSVGVSRLSDDVFDSLLEKMAKLQDEFAKIDANVQAKESEVSLLPELIKKRDEITESVAKISSVLKKKTLDENDIKTLKEARESLAEIYSIAEEEMPGGGFLATVAFSLDSIGDAARNAIKGFLGFTVFGFLQNQLQNIASQTFEVTKRFQVLENTINFLSGGTKAGADQMAFLRAEVDRTSSVLEPAIQGYKNLAASTRNTPLEGKTTNNLTSALMQAGTVFGMTGEQVEGSISAISQIAGKGTVSMEELRGQLAERIPGAFQIAARSMNLTEQELFKLISTGQLAATDFLPKFAAQLSLETAGGVTGASKTAQAALNRLNNAILEIQVEAGKQLQGGLVLGMDVISSVMRIATEHAGTFVNVLQIAAGVALSYAAPAMFAFVKSIMAIPMASFAASAAVSGLGNAITAFLLPAITKFAATVAIVWVVIEAIKILANVWDAFAGKTTSQTWSEALSTNLKKSKQDVEDLRKEIDKINKLNTPLTPGKSPETEYSINKESLKGRLEEKGIVGRMRYALSPWEYMSDMFSTGGALKQTIKDQRDVENLKQSRKSGSIKDLEDWIIPAMTQENIDKIKEYNKQIESLRQKSTLIKDPIQQTRLKEQIQQIRLYRDVAGKPLEDGLKYATVEIENRKKQINETNDDRLKEQYQNDIKFFEGYVKQLKEIERQTGAQTTLTELLQVLSRLRVEMENFNRVAQELADKNLKAIAETELKGLRTNVFASAEAGLKRAENSLTLVQEKVKGSKTTIKGLQALLQDPLMTQYNEFYKDKSLEQLRVDLEGVDEADGQRRKALEAMIFLREQESGIIALQREEAESVLALEKERSQVLLNRFDFQKAEDQNKVQIGEAKSLTRITRSRLGGQFNQSEMDEARAKVSLSTSQQNQKLSQDQLATLQGYYNQGKISAEEFATRRRELELQVAQTIQQVADNELQLRQSTQTKILEQIDRRIAIANAKQQQTENASTQAIRQQQLDRVINEQQAEVRIAQVRKTSLAQNLQAVQTQLEEVRNAYAKKQIEESEFRQRERDLMTQSSDLSRQLVEQELQIRQSLQNEILTQIERRLANANALQQQGENAAVQAIRQQQLNRIITEQQAESRISQIRKKSLTENLQAVKKQLEEIRAANEKGQIEQIEFNQRQRDLVTQLSDLNKQLIEQNLQIQQQKQQEILDLLERQNQRLDHQLKIQEAIAQLNQKSGQIRRENIGTQQELSLLSNPRQQESLKLQLTRQTEDETLAIQQQTSTRYTAELQRRLSELRKHYEDGNLSHREYEDRSRQIEQELTTAKVQLKDYELQNAQRINQRLIEDRERMNRQMVEDLDRAIKKQDSLLQLSAIQNEQRIRQRQLSQANSIGNGRAEQQAAIALTRFQEEQLKKQLKSTIEQIQEVAKLREENALTQWEAEDRTADLTIKSEQLKLDLINKQIEKTRQLKDLRIQALDDELARIDSLFGRQQMGLTYEIEQRKLITDELDREKSLLESQSRLQQALIRGEEQRAQATLDRSRNAEDLMGRLPDLQKRLSEGGLTYQQQRGTQYLRELIQQFSGAQTGNAMLPESQLQQLRTNQYNESANAEQRLLEMKTRHLEQQQRIQLAQTELQQRMNRLTAENNIMEMNISVNKARQAELQAKIALDKARINGDPREIQNAQLSYDLAQQNTLLSQQQFGNAVQRLSLTDQLSGLDQQSTLAEQGNERFALGEANRKALQDLALRGGELASQGSISLDSMLRIDPTSIQYGLEPIAPAIDNLSSQLNSKFDQMLTELKELNSKPASASVESLTIVSSDPTGDSRQVLDDMVRARNMYER